MFALVETLWQELQCRHKWKMSLIPLRVRVCLRAQCFSFFCLFFYKEALLKISDMFLQDRRPAAGAQRRLVAGCCLREAAMASCSPASVPH